MATNTDRTDTIAAAKRDAGDNAYLWLHASGDCILWSSEADSLGDAGAQAIGRWHLSPTECDALVALGIVDDVA